MEENFQDTENEGMSSRKRRTGSKRRTYRSSGKCSNFKPSSISRFLSQMTPSLSVKYSLQSLTCFDLAFRLTGDFPGSASPLATIESTASRSAKDVIGDDNVPIQPDFCPDLVGVDSTLVGVAFKGEPLVGIPKSAKSPPSFRRFEAVVFGDQEAGTFCLVLRRGGSAEGGSDEGSSELKEDCRLMESMIDII